MAGDSYLQLYVYACTPTDVIKAAPVLDRHGLDHDGDVIVLGGAYTDRERWGEDSKGLASDLIEQAPRISFITWTDPVPEGPGSLVIYTPQLGRFDAECDDSGDPQFSTKAIRKVLAEAPQGLDRFLGTPWVEAISALKDSLPATRRVKAPHCPDCDELGECEIACPTGDPDCQARECEDHGHCLALAREEDQAHAVNATLARLVDA